MNSGRRWTTFLPDAWIWIGCWAGSTAQLLLHPNSQTELATLLDELQRSNRIPAQIVTSLRARLAQYTESAEDAAGGETRIRSDRGTGHPAPISNQATRIVGTPVPSPSRVGSNTSLALHHPSPQATQVARWLGDILNGRFVLEDEIGRGGMGVVYLAKDLRKEEARDRDPYVAIKVLNEGGAAES